jgi:hypothetical protein
LSPNPSNITAHCKTFFEINLIPLSNLDLSRIIRVITMPAKIAMTAPPTIGNTFPKNQDGIAIAKDNKIPNPFFLIKSTSKTPFYHFL